MLKQVSTNVDSNMVHAILAPTTERIWCDHCDTDEYILIEQARKRRHHSESTWDVDYVCTNCDGFYGHDILAETLTTPMAVAIITLIQHSGQDT